MSLTITQVDAFADKPFAGNPAAVCILEHPRDGAWMQLLAREMNLSETAFLVKQEQGYGLRWFTPAVEVDLCGHATLATAHLLLTRLDPSRQAVRFNTRSGALTVARDGDRLVMDFPSRPASATPPAPGLLEALGGNPVEVLLSGQA